MHFYAGVIAAPFLVLLALTGLVILYRGPVERLTQHDLRVVHDAGTPLPLTQQLAAVKAAYPDAEVTSLDVAKDSTSSSSFGLDNNSVVFVDPYTAKVLGSAGWDDGIVQLANRLHGNLNNERVKVPFVSIGALVGDGGWIKHYVVGDMVLEIAGGWILVLAVSGLYLWWPRRSREPRSTRKARWWPRLTKTGRARWRDLHAIPGVLYCGVLVLTVFSGFFWADHWGTNFTSVANKLTPNSWQDAPNSALPKLGDVDRQGSKIPWNTGSATVPNSSAGAAALPAPLTLDAVAAIANDVGMKPGYTISFPTDGEDEAGNPTYGSFTLSNSWPRATGEARSVFVDQFSGKTLGEMNVYGYGGVSYAADTLVSIHMGTQFGIFDRILMTVMCVGTLWSVISGAVMYVKRRRRGTLGLPRRPLDLRLGNRLIVIACVMGVVFPLWGLTLLIALVVDRFIIRRTPRLRHAFGQR